MKRSPCCGNVSALELKYGARLSIVSLIVIKTANFKIKYELTFVLFQIMF